MPNDKGMTSKSNHSLFLLWLPANKSACIAAPRATTWSGFKLFNGVVPNNSPTALCTLGIRVAPPTITTPLISSAFKPASRNALRTATKVLLTRFWVISKNWAWLTPTLTTTPSLKIKWTRLKAAWLKCSLADLQANNSARWSCNDKGGNLACSITQQNKRWSKSSPPKAVSPPVDKTSNTPLLIRKIEMSKVPPPRS